MMFGGFTHSTETFPILGVFLKPITEEFGWTRSQFTWAMTIGTVAGSVVAVGAGRLLDKYGGRWLLAIGFVVLGASLVDFFQLLHREYWRLTQRYYASFPLQYFHYCIRHALYHLKRHLHYAVFISMK
jgi:MFS family permease